MNYETYKVTIENHIATEDALKYQVVWNVSMIFSNDMPEAFQASMEKRAPKYEN